MRKEGKAQPKQSAHLPSLQVCDPDIAHVHRERSNWSCLPRDKQKEGGIDRLGVTHTAWPTGSLAVHPDRVGITSPISGIAPGVFGAGPERIGLDPSAPAIGCLYILSEVHLVYTDTQSFGKRRAVAVKAARDGTVGVDCGSEEYDSPGRLRQFHDIGLIRH